MIDNCLLFYEVRFMTVVMKKRILQRMQELEHDIDALKRAQI